MGGIVVYYYTDKVGVAAGTVGTILLFAKLIDAVTDLIMGWVMDRTKSRWGSARPWLLWMTIPTLLAIVGLFLVPPDASEGVKAGVVFGVNVFSSAFVYTAIAIPFGSMLYYTTKSTEERSKMGIIRAAVGYATGMVIVIGYIPITNALGGDQKAWIIFASIVAVFAALCLFVAFCANPERNRDANDDVNEKTPFRLGMKHLFQNKYWVIMLCVMTVVNVVYGVSGSSSIYYVKWVLGDENLMALVGALGLLPVIIGFAAVGPIVKRIGPARMVKYSLLIGAVASIVRAIFPYDLWALIIFGSLVTLSTIPLMAIGGVLVTSTIAYGEWKFGTRLVGMANAASGFGAKMGNGLGVAAVGWILTLGGYNGIAAEQSESSRQQYGCRASHSSRSTCSCGSTISTSATATSWPTSMRGTRPPMKRPRRRPHLHSGAEGPVDPSWFSSRDVPMGTSPPGSRRTASARDRKPAPPIGPICHACR
jgi:GPH family glycoside/pentoside/hexuronide:cation symporter